MSLPRYAPHIPFPSYSYVPGMWPHPFSDHAGHSYGKHPEPAILTSDDDWQTCERYLYAVDLFNHGYYWESHEAWESLWHAAGRTSKRAKHFLMLIKLAVAGVKAREARPNGVQHHLSRAQELITEIESTFEPSQASYWGINFVRLKFLIGEWRATPHEQHWTTKSPSLIVWPQPLELQNAGKP